MKISIDAGGTLLKIVYIENDERVFDKVPSRYRQLHEKLNKNHPDADIYITGGKAEYMSRKLNHDVNISIEFDATYIGLKQLMNEQGLHIERFVYLNVGTGTSFHQADMDGQKKSRRFRCRRRHPDGTVLSSDRH